MEQTWNKNQNAKYYLLNYVSLSPSLIKHQASSSLFNKACFGNAAGFSFDLDFLPDLLVGEAGFFGFDLDFFWFLMLVCYQHSSHLF